MRLTTHQRSEVFWTLLCSVVAGVCVSMLLVTLILLVFSGHQALSWHLLTQPWNHRNIAAGGLLQAIVGSVILGLGVLIVSLPLGTGTALFLTEFSPDTWFNRLVRVAIRNLAGVPSIVFGLFGLVFFVSILGFGTSLLSGIFTLSSMSLPWVITASVEALEAVPRKFRDSSAALGATTWQTSRYIVLPAAAPGCLTGGIISMARALGETAPIILVGATFFLNGYPHSLHDKFMALPYHTFILATQHADSAAQTFAAGTALVLIVLTVILSASAIILRYRFRRRKIW